VRRRSFCVVQQFVPIAQHQTFESPPDVVLPRKLMMLRRAPPAPLSVVRVAVSEFEAPQVAMPPTRRRFLPTMSSCCAV
jgi:hypothetical protein